VNGRCFAPAISRFILVRRIVKVGDKDVKLSPKEYDLLRILVQHAGEVLTHEFLLGEL
jgi:two-component system, OmpR family, KDP operon response regulator KdpE